MMWTVAHLQGCRGWTASLIKRFLGPPDLLKRSPWNRGAGPGLRLYAPERVRAMENTPAFRLALSKAKRRRQAGQTAAATRRANLRRRADAMAVEVVVLDHAELQRRAIFWHNSRQTRLARGRRPHEPLLVTPETSPLELGPIMVRYAAGALASYDRALPIAARRAGAGDVVEAVDRKIRAAVIAAYPDLGGDGR